MSAAAKQMSPGMPSGGSCEIAETPPITEDSGKSDRAALAKEDAMCYIEGGSGFRPVFL